MNGIDNGVILGNAINNSEQSPTWEELVNRALSLEQQENAEAEKAENLLEIEKAKTAALLAHIVKLHDYINAL